MMTQGDWQWPQNLSSQTSYNEFPLHTVSCCFSCSLDAADFGQLLSGVMSEKKEEKGQKRNERKKEESTQAVGAVWTWRRC